MSNYFAKVVLKLNEIFPKTIWPQPLAEKEGFDRFFDGVAWEYREQPQQEEEPEAPESEKPEQPYDYADPAVIALAVAVAAQEERLSALEGGAKA